MRRKAGMGPKVCPEKERNMGARELQVMSGAGQCAKGKRRARQRDAATV